MGLQQEELIKNIFYNNIINVVVNIQLASSLLAVSDGSAQGHHMTYGWLISNTDGTKIVLEEQAVWDLKQQGCY